MRIEEIQTVCFVGAGTMGCYNSIVAAVSGYDVVLYDIDKDTLDQAPERHEEFSAMLVAHSYCTQDAISQAVQRISFAANLEQATANADLVSESIVERLDIKRAVHQELDQVCPGSTILTTNSSMLLVSDIEDVVGRGDRFAALHSHLGSPLVDIVGGPRTSAATIEILNRYVLSTGGVPLLLKKEYPGYILNAMLGPLLGAAMLMVSEGAATIQEVDRAWMRHCNAPMGPFGMIDLFGLNLIYDTWQYREEDPATADRRSKILALLQPFIDAGELGMKSARGFYQYPDPGYQHADFLDDAANDTASYSALITAVVGNAVLVAAHDVAEPNDIDRAWMTGTYLEAGPFAILAQLGTTAFLAILA
ncbi:MAG: 3-hydroxyacyl-CoA dehydrogenase NAD-binding domain-containing protein, partial [Halioglobus sp.]